MDTNKAIITSNVISGERWLIIKKIREIFAKFSKPHSKELIEIQFRDNDEIIFKTGEEAWQYAQKIDLGITDKNGNNL